MVVEVARCIARLVATQGPIVAARVAITIAYCDVIAIVLPRLIMALPAATRSIIARLP